MVYCLLRKYTLHADNTKSLRNTTVSYTEVFRKLFVLSACSVYFRSKQIDIAEIADTYLLTVEW